MSSQQEKVREIDHSKDTTVSGYWTQVSKVGIRKQEKRIML